MTGRQDRIYQEAAELWRELYGEIPPGVFDGATILDMITRNLPTQEYDRLVSPHIRPANISFPKT